MECTLPSDLNTNKVSAPFGCQGVPTTLKTPKSAFKTSITELDLTELCLQEIYIGALPDITDLYLNRLPKNYLFPSGYGFPPSLKRLYLNHYEEDTVMPRSIEVNINLSNAQAILKTWNGLRSLNLFSSEGPSALKRLENEKFNASNHSSVNVFGLSFNKCSITLKPKPPVIVESKPTAIIPNPSPTITPSPTRTVIDAEWYERELAASMGYDYDAVETEIERIMVELVKAIGIARHNKTLHTTFNGYVSIKQDAGINECPDGKICELVQKRLPSSLIAFVRGGNSHRNVNVYRHNK